jgi:hypothetical protein
MPPQNRVWRHNRGHLPQRLAPETASTRRQAAPLIIREPRPSAAQLGPARLDALPPRYPITSCGCRFSQPPMQFTRRASAEF